jgi:hypothetical protein
MKMLSSVHLHFDGKVFIPDEPVNVPIHQPLIADLRQMDTEDETNNINSSINMTDDERKKGLREFVDMMATSPIIPLEALRRINLYDDDSY